MRQIFHRSVLLALIFVVPASPGRTGEVPSVAPSENAEQSVDGVYFLAADAGTARLLRISKGRFDIRLIGNLGGTVSGYFHGGQADVHLTYFNDAKLVRCECSSAVIDGRLWIGVFVRDRHQQDLFISRTRHTGMFGSSQRGMPAGTIRWDMGKGTWSLTGLEDNFNNADVIENVRVIRHTDNADDSRLMPVFADDQLPKIATIFRDDGPRNYRDWASWWAMAAGLFVANDWELKKQLAPAGNDAALRTKLIDKLLRVGVGRGTFQRHGDVILTPWSVDLGPIGLTPAKQVADKLLGEYVAVDNDKLHATVKKPEKVDNPPLIPHLIVPRGRTPAEWKTTLATLKIDPDDWGLNRRTYFENCMMGHTDWPGYDFWLPLTDGRLARYIIPSTHMPPNDWPVRKVILMQK